MSFDCLWALQQAVYSRLTTTSAVTTLLPNGANNIYDHVPPQPDMPHIMIGDASLTPIGTQATDTYQITFAIVCFSQTDGMKEIKKITSAVFDSLHQHSLTVTGYDAIDITAKNIQITRGNDGKTRIGQIQCHVILEPSA